MFRTRFATVGAVALVITACGGGSTPTNPPVATTPPAAATTPAVAATTPPAAAATTPAAAATTPAVSATATPGAIEYTVEVALVDGPDKGSHRGNADPHCSFGFLERDVWGVAYEDTAVTGDEGVGGLNVTTDAFTGGDATFGFKSSLFIGPFMSGTQYTVIATAADDTQNSINEFPPESGITRIHLEGTSVDGFYVQITVNCPSVTRG